MRKSAASGGDFLPFVYRNSPELLNASQTVTKLNQKEPRKVLQHLKHYVFPENPVDRRVVARLKRGAIHYAQVNSWWPLPPVQRWIRNHRFQFRHAANGSATRVSVSGADITHLWVADEVLIEQVYELDAVPFVPDLVIDLGANIGLFTLLAAKRWPKASLVCVEPHPTTFSFLCDNLALNGVNATKLQCALDAEVSMKFMENDGAVYQALSERATATRVMTVKFDSLLPAQANQKLLIKMDIEGSEVTVLEKLQARLPQDCFVFIELHKGDESLLWINDWAARNGFEFRSIRRREEAIDGYLLRQRPLKSQSTAADSFERHEHAELACAGTNGGVA
jgi:FkbM family methyltransferase